jgi:hypothetical protein
VLDSLWFARGNVGFLMTTSKTAQALLVNYNVRPVRVAFLMAKPEHEVLQEIINVNTLLWGGMLNPIVVLDGSTRPAEAYASYTYDEGVVRLLKEFDPDVLINFSAAEVPPYLDLFKHRIFDRSSLRWDPWGRGEINFFLEVWPFLSRYWKQVHQFLKKPELEFSYADISTAGNMKTYLSARFGSYPNDEGYKILAENFGATPFAYDEDFRKSFKLRQKTFPIQLTTFGLNVLNPGFFHSHSYFLMDPTNVFDIVDFWNLRAAGSRVFALPAPHYRDFEKSIVAFGEEATYPINESVMNYPTVIKARSLTEEFLIEVGQWIAGLGVKGIACQRWVPLWGERGYRISKEIDVRPPSAEDVNQTVLMTNGFGSLEVTSPECEFRESASSQHWAIDLRVFGSGDDEHTWRLPWLNPECDEYLNARVGHGHQLTATRVSKHGIAAIRRGERDSLSLHEPEINDVLKAYLRGHGVSYLKVSSPGLALERILEQMGGLFGCRAFQNPGVRGVIEKLSNGAPMHVETVRRTILRDTRMGRKQQIKAAQQLLEGLIQKRVLRQGLEFQCERCQRWSWYGLDEFGDEYKCKRCFHTQPVRMLGENPWQYTSDGLFTLPGKMAGCLAAATALVCLRYFIDDDFKIVPSFDYQDGVNDAERDFAVFTSGFLEDDVDVVFGECKTAEYFADEARSATASALPDLEQKERDDMRRLGKLTGAYLAFCTLAPDFSDADKEFFGQLVKDKQRLILLTKTHLEMDHSAASAYENKARGAPLRGMERLSRLTVIDCLGEGFAKEQRIWI